MDIIILNGRRSSVDHAAIVQFQLLLIIIKLYAGFHCTILFFCYVNMSNNFQIINIITI